MNTAAPEGTAHRVSSLQIFLTESSSRQTNGRHGSGIFPEMIRGYFFKAMRAAMTQVFYKKELQCTNMPDTMSLNVTTPKLLSNRLGFVMQ
jgi:hypothetical protein